MPISGERQLWLGFDRVFCLSYIQTVPPAYMRFLIKNIFMFDRPEIIENHPETYKQDDSTDFDEFLQNYLTTGNLSSSFSPKEILLFGLEIYPKFDKQLQLAKLLVSQLVLLQPNSKLRHSFTPKVINILSKLDGNIEFLLDLEVVDLDEKSQREISQILAKYYLKTPDTDKPSPKNIQKLLKFHCDRPDDLEYLVSGPDGAILISIVAKNDHFPTPYNPSYLLSVLIPILFQKEQAYHHISIFTLLLNSIPKIEFLQSPNELYESFLDRLTKIIITFPKEVSISAFEALHLLISKSSFNVVKYIFVMDLPVLNTLMIRSIKRLSKTRGLNEVYDILFNLDSVIYGGLTTPDGFVAKADMIMEVLNLIKYLKLQGLGDFIEQINSQLFKVKVMVDDKDRFNLDILQFTLDTLPQEV